MFIRPLFGLITLTTALCGGCANQGVNSPYAQRSVLADGTTVDWRSDVRWAHTPNHQWSLGVSGHVTRPNDGRVVVAATKHLDVHHIDGLLCKPISWNTPGGRDTSGKWWRNRQIDEPLKSRFKIELEHIEQPVDSIKKIELGGVWLVANNVRTFDIPVSDSNRWLDATPGLRVRCKLYRKKIQDGSETTGQTSFHVTYDASVDYVDDYLSAGNTYITTHAVYDDGSTGSAYMSGGSGSRGTTTREYAFRGGDLGQQIKALRVFYATGWESEPFRFTVEMLDTPFNETPR